MSNREITIEKGIVDNNDIMRASKKLKDVIVRTPLQYSKNLSDRYKCNLYLKREDLQVVRSYKLRGAYNKISSLTDDEKSKGVVCASAGNHAQGFAYSCHKLKIQGVVYMPAPTTRQKISQVEMFGGEYVTINLIGDTFDDAFNEAKKDSEANDKAFVHPFDDMKIIEGQGTVGQEIYEDSQEDFDYLFIPVGGGGLSAGVGSFFNQVSPQTKLIGLEPSGAPAMKKSIEKGVNTELERIDKFVDGAAVKKVGDINFAICKNVLNDIVLVDEGKVCTTILELYNEEALVVEPAGALSIAALDQFKEEIKGKNVCAIVSGGNNDIVRMAEIKERSMMYEGLKHYFVIRLPQRAGALKEFLVEILGPKDDICYFEYKKKNSRTSGPVVLGIELSDKKDFEPLKQRMEKANVMFQYLNNDVELFEFLI